VENIKIVADVPIAELPSWAVWERHLIDSLNDSVHPFLEHFTREDGEFIWEDEFGGGSCDDFYEPFFSWPVIYMMGGGDHMLKLADYQWEAITRQLTRLGAVHKDYGIKEDNFHQCEGDIFFYNLCLADPRTEKWRERARRFAGFYLNEDPEAINYDPEHKIVMSPLNGSKGAYIAPPETREKRSYAPLGGTMERYSLPYFDIPGIATVQDLGDPAKAKAMGQAMYDRQSRGDLVTNAFLVSGEEKYRDWVVEYTDAWIERGKQNGGFIPDNVGLSGKVGEYCNGSWYGGLYGWTWPHGFGTLIAAIFDAGANAYLLTRDSDYLDLPRSQIDLMLDMGEMRASDDTDPLHPTPARKSPSSDEVFMVPRRYGDAGWFDWSPVPMTWPIALWNLSMADADWQRIETIRGKSATDWNEVHPFHGKTDAGHEAAWIRFLAGDNDDYPERILHATEQIVRRRLALTREDTSVGTRHHVHHWQWANPVSSEALVQLTLGAPQQIYNGGLLHTRLRYFDSQRRCPGLPADVAALVEKIEADRTVVRLVNLSGNETRELILQAGAFGEHRFGTAAWSSRTSLWPGELGGYAGTAAAAQLQADGRRVEVNSSHCPVVLPPGMEITLDLSTERYVNEPAYSNVPF
jgi:hypothetical protein